MKITILIEGRTEQAFKPHLIAFLKPRLVGNMPRLDMFPYHGRIPKGGDLCRKVETLLSDRQASQAVIGLTDVYTGTDDFTNAADAKTKMRRWVNNNPAFYPHVAQHDFEAWLIPFGVIFNGWRGIIEVRQKVSLKRSTINGHLLIILRRYLRLAIVAIVTLNPEMRIEYFAARIWLLPPRSVLSSNHS